MGQDAATDSWTLLTEDRGGDLVLWSALGCLDGRLVSFGGDGWSATVQVSEDGGRTWAVLDGNCPPRLYAAGAVMDQQLWIAGGQENDDVWCSPDGRTWSRTAAGAPWGQRWQHTVIPFNGRLYLLGGTQQGHGPMGDVWRLDGAGWNLVNAQAFAPRYSTAGAVLGGQMVLVGGHDATPSSEDPSKGAMAEVLISADGETWISRKPPWSPRWWANAAVLDDTLYLVGGMDCDGVVCRDVWATRDAVNWTQVGDAPWTSLCQCGLGVCGDHLVLAGGLDGGERNRAVWAFRPPAA